jgi:hypothetical protein
VRAGRLDPGLRVECLDVVRIEKNGALIVAKCLRMLNSLDSTGRHEHGSSPISSAGCQISRRVRLSTLCHNR